MREGVNTEPMGERRRGVTLTIFAILFGLLAISNFMKPIGAAHSAAAGFVFFGTRTTGIANIILGPLFGVILAAYAIGIWRMKKYALPLSHAYATYVVLNLFFFVVKHPDPANARNAFFEFLYIPIAIGIPLASAIILTRRRDELT